MCFDLKNTSLRGVFENELKFFVCFCFKEILNELEKEDANFIGEVIKTHMGPWIEDYNGNKVLEPPKTKYQNFVHMCDFLASRKCLLVPFDNENNISA